MTCPRCAATCGKVGALGFLTAWRCSRCRSLWETFEQTGTGLRAMDGYARPIAA